jgi:hypothetical protein
MRTFIFLARIKQLLTAILSLGIGFSRLRSCLYGRYTGPVNETAQKRG